MDKLQDIKELVKRQKSFSEAQGEGCRPSTATTKQRRKNFSDASLTQISEFKSFFYIFLDWCGVLLLLTLPSLTSKEPLIYLLCFLLMPRFQKGLAILGHDGVHKRLFESKKLNDRVSQWVLAAPILRDFYSYQVSHSLHHKYTQGPKDPDLNYFFKPPTNRKKLYILFAQALCGWSFTYQLISNYKRYLKAILYSLKNKKPISPYLYIKTSRAVTVMISQSLGQLFIFTYCFLINSPESYFILWLLPLFTLNVFYSRLRQIAEHTGLPSLYEDSKNHSRSFSPNTPLSFFIAPHNSSLHAEHHKFPQVPFYNLAKVKLINKDKYFNNYSAALKDVFPPQKLT